MDSIFVALLVMALIVGLYFGSYILNKNTAAPEGARVIDKCSTCGTGSCSLPTKESFKNSPDEECEIYEEVK